jgi:hypothetical protein
MSTELDKSRFIIENDSPIGALDCQKAFDRLSGEECLYAHYLAQASWYGSLIILHQVRFLIFNLKAYDEFLFFRLRSNRR